MQPIIQFTPEEALNLLGPLIAERDKLKSDYETCFNALHNLCNRMAGIRENIQVIVIGQIERGHALTQYDARPGLRKLRLDDAKRIAEGAVHNINRAINTAHNATHPDIFNKSTL